MAHDTAQGAPRGPSRALQRTDNLGFSKAGLVAARVFHEAKSRHGSFRDHFHRPAVGSLFKGEGAQHIRAAGAKRTEVTDLYAVQKPDQAGGEVIAEGLVPR